MRNVHGGGGVAVPATVEVLSSGLLIEGAGGCCEPCRTRKHDSGVTGRGPGPHPRTAARQRCYIAVTVDVCKISTHTHPCLSGNVSGILPHSLLRHANFYCAGAMMRQPAPSRRRIVTAIVAALAPIAALTTVLVLPQSASAAVPAPPPGWTTVFSDDFNGAAGSGLNHPNWLYDLG